MAGVVPNVSQVYATPRLRLYDKCTSRERGLLRLVSIRIPAAFPWRDTLACIAPPAHETARDRLPRPGRSRVILFPASPLQGFPQGFPRHARREAVSRFRHVPVSHVTRLPEVVDRHPFKGDTR